MVFDRKDFQEKLVGKMDFLTAYWFANCMEYIRALEERVKLLEEQTKQEIEG